MLNLNFQERLIKNNRLKRYLKSIKIIKLNKRRIRFINLEEIKVFKFFIENII